MKEKTQRWTWEVFGLVLLLLALLAVPTQATEEEP